MIDLHTWFHVRRQVAAFNPIFSTCVATKSQVDLAFIDKVFCVFIVSKSKLQM